MFVILSRRRRISAKITGLPKLGEILHPFGIQND